MIKKEMFEVMYVGGMLLNKVGDQRCESFCLACEAKGKFKVWNNFLFFEQT